MPDLNQDTSKVRSIAFYLPQFHPVPENDEWWGRGFTEWRNVVKARSLFRGHYQPHLPADLGFYDLRLPEVREAQAALAREYGIHGFCYYHYWFNGRRILERPFAEVLESGKPDFPFCLCWANENWTRAWDGGNARVLLEQNYSEADDLEHIKSLFPAFRDERYIRVDGRPLFLVYRTSLLPDVERTTETWREAAIKAGIGDLYLARVESHGDESNPEEMGFDASIEFLPNWQHSGVQPYRNKVYRMLSRLGLFPKALTDWVIYDYDEMVKALLRRPVEPYKLFRCASPSWDNSARRSKGGLIIKGATPEKYGYHLSRLVKEAESRTDSEERIVFINAWNEWAEGNHLEPDQHWGSAYLENTRRALHSPDEMSEKVIRPLPPYTRPVAILKFLFDRYVGWRFSGHAKDA